MRKAFTLLELNAQVREAIEAGLPDEYWVQAELSDISERGGHCYMELVQNDDDTHTPIARARAICWRNNWQVIAPNFEQETGQVFHRGMKVLLQVYANFHENFGFSWIVTDVDPTYTLGDMARRRQEIINKLKAEGVYDLQKELEIPMFAQRVAVISSESAAGYGDFCHQLQENEYGYQFSVTLFPSVMQGEGVEQGVIAALNRINSEIEHFDVVVIIRGGGATADLSGFDTLELAENVANFPLPVITGIGHDRDESILDLISHTRVKTPTAAAAFLIDHLSEVARRIDHAQERIVGLVAQKLQMEQLRIQKLSERLSLSFSVVTMRHNAQLDQLMARLGVAARAFMSEQHHRLELLEQRVSYSDPGRLLKRGYSITTCKGKLVKSAASLKAGDEIETLLNKGKVKSIVK